MYMYMYSKYIDAEVIILLFQTLET